MVETIKLSEILNLRSKLNFVMGGSGAGKTFFLHKLLAKFTMSKLTVYGFDRGEWSPFESVKNIDFAFIEEDPFANDEINSIRDQFIVFEDFSLQKQQEKHFYKFVNYTLRHHNITLFIIAHSLFKTNLFHKIVSGTSIFLTSSPNNVPFCQKWDKLYFVDSLNLLKYNMNLVSSTNRPVLYLTNQFMVNNIDELLKDSPSQPEKVKMFKNDKVYYLLETSKYQLEESSTTEQGLETSLESFLDNFEEIYPKRFNKIKLLIKAVYGFLQKNKFLNEDDMVIIINKLEMSLYDFIIASQNPSKKPLDKKVRQVLLELKKQNFKVPKFTLINGEFKAIIA